MIRILLAGAAAIAFVAITPQLAAAQPVPPGGPQGAPMTGGEAGPPHPPSHPMPPMPPATFFFGRDSASVTCPANDSLRDCVEAATTLANNFSRIHEREMASWSRR